MNEMMLQEIHSQPDTWREALPDLRQQVSKLGLSRIFDKIILTGSGDSYINALAVENLFRSQLPIEVRALGSLEAGRYEKYNERSLLVAISISGGVSRTIEAALRAKSQGATTLALAAKSGSGLGQACQAELVMPKPLTRSTPHTRDYTLTNCALVVLLESLCQTHFDLLDAWPQLAGELIQRSFQEIPPRISPSPRTWFLGTGADRATAMYGAMKFWEGAAMQAWPDELEEFVHGSKEITAGGEAVVVIASREGVDRAVEMLPGFRTLGLKPWIITDEALPDEIPSFQIPAYGPCEWMPLISCIPLQVLVYSTAQALGIEAALPNPNNPHTYLTDEVHAGWTKSSQIVA
jgi:glutamine---fructose-6-phosphate transaminase (isomerizing)